MEQRDIIILEPTRPLDTKSGASLGEVLDYPCVRFAGTDDLDALIGESPPRLAIISHEPPRCDAISMLKSLKNSYPWIDVVVALPGNDPELIRAAFRAGASDCLLDADLADAGSLKRRLSGLVSREPGVLHAFELDSLRPLLDGLADAVSIQDRDLRIMYQNPAHRALVGDHLGELCYKSYSGSDESCDGCPVSACFEDGNPHRITKKGGHGLVVDITASPLKDESGNVWGGLEMVRDITARQKLEDALRNSAEGVSSVTGESFFHSLTEYLVETLGVTASFIGVLDENDPGLSRTISVYHGGKHLNNFWYPMNGTPCGEVAKRGTCVFQEALLEDFPDIDMLKQLGAKCYIGTPLIGSAGKFLGVLSIIDAGSKVDTNLAESLLLIFASRASAELDRLKVEHVLRESGRRLIEMLENIKLASVMLDTEGGITFANDFLLEMTGWSREEVLGRNWFEVFVPSDVSYELNKYFQDIIASREMPPHYENEILTRESENRLVSWNNTLLRDDSGDVIGVCSIGEDITERRRAEEERSELFHMLTHDIKGPLSIVNGYSELILGDESGVTVKDSAKEIQKASRRLFALIEDMLTLSAMESGSGRTSDEPVNVPELVESVLADVRLRAEEMNVSMSVESMDAGMPLVYIEGSQMRRAVENLLYNAINYNRFGGDVRVKCGLDEGADRIFMEVSDTGVGIPEPDLPHIFDKYYRSKVTGKKHGTGLGLAIVKKAVESCGGTVAVWNNPGGGATFRLVLPFSRGR